MSYTFLQESGEESLAASFLDIPQFVLLRLNLTADESSCNANEMESCQSSQSGMMSAHSTGSLGEEKLMLCVEDSLAKTSVVQGGGRTARRSERIVGRNGKDHWRNTTPIRLRGKQPNAYYSGTWKSPWRNFRTGV